MFTEEQITKSTNRTPVGLASWCWSHRVNYARYLILAVEQNVSALAEEQFNYIQNWWNESWAGFSGIKA